MYSSATFWFIGCMYRVQVLQVIQVYCTVSAYSTVVNCRDAFRVDMLHKVCALYVIDWPTTKFVLNFQSFYKMETKAKKRFMTPEMIRLIREGAASVAEPAKRDIKAPGK